MSVEDIGAGGPAAPAPAPEPPPRPAAVPATAVWSEQTGVWELAPCDAAGRPDGVTRAWRADGTLASATTFRAGERDGAWRRFHPDGAVAREGVYVGGQAHGRMEATGTDADTTEPLQSCCVPPGAWRLQHDYEHGNLTEIRWYDRAGVHILPSGKPHPVRPASVPREARFEDGRDQWVTSRYGDGGTPEGIWLRWARDGVLRERDEYDAGKAHGQWQRWDAAGALEEQSTWRDGARTGEYRRVGVPADLYTDARVHEERGAFDGNQFVGAWALLDAAGVSLRTLRLGAALTDDGLRASPALADALPADTAETWLARADALAAEDRPAEALLAAARAAACGRDAAPLRARLEALTLPRRAEGALALAADLVTRADGGLAFVANGLPAGADPAALLRALASSLTGRDLVALDLVDAGLLLAPDRPEGQVTRALIFIHLGRPDEARAAVAALPEEHAEQRDFLTAYARVVFTDFPFAPAAVGEIATRFEDVPAAPEQPLEKVVAAARKYATRLGLLRAAVAARVPPGAPPPWLPPDLSALLPDGPVALETWEFEEIVQDEQDEADEPADGAPPEATLVTVNERLELDAGTSLPSLMRLARREWTGLCWLCWGVGLDRVALPTAVPPRADFGAAAGMAIERLWRCRDKLITGGLRAMTQGVPGFTWEGVEIDLLPGVLAEIAADEYREMRAVFYWLCDEGVQSPWQDNLHTPD